MGWAAQQAQRPNNPHDMMGLDMSLSLSDDQRLVARSLWKWLFGTTSRQYCTLGGFAGTGKTTLIAVFAEVLHTKKDDFSIAFVSFTGKAAHVLRQTLSRQGPLAPGDRVSTIHSLMYEAKESENNGSITWRRKKKLDFDLIVVDEASMVTRDLWEDLMAYGIPILAVGDHGQLPPIGEAFNLMSAPELRLERIHRQAAQSPIIQLSAQIRETGEIPYGVFGPGVIKLKKDEAQDQIELSLRQAPLETMVLCGFNTTRHRLNQWSRSLHGHESAHPEPGDWVMCLKNMHKDKVYNGMLGQLQSSQWHAPYVYQAEVSIVDRTKILSGYFSFPPEVVSDQRQGDEEFAQVATEEKKLSVKKLKELGVVPFDYGYVFTVHKAQGSQAPKVLLFEERSKHMDDETWRRWLYTAVTRAEEELVVVG